MKIETAIGLIEERLREVRIALSFTQKSMAWAEPELIEQYLARVKAYQSEVEFLESLKTILEG